jgi:hypothetical protein
VCGLVGTDEIDREHAGVVSTAGCHVESTCFFARVTEHLAVTASCTPRGQCGATRSREARICLLTCVVPTGFEPVSPP